MAAIEKLIREGFQVLMRSGNYCWVSRDDRDLILRWQDEAWIVVG